jgi:hypothetical protein
MTKKAHERWYPGYKKDDPAFRLIHDQARVMSDLMKQWLDAGARSGHRGYHMEELRARAAQ